jgi:hypothetical protein
VGDGSGEKKVKVVDRRWLTPEGDLRDLPEEPTPAASSAAPADLQAPAVSATQPPDQADLAGESGESTAPPRPNQRSLSVGPGLLDLVDVLAQQAMVLLSGQVPGRGRDAESGRIFVDLLGVLKEKTAGNRTLEETNYLDDVLYQLRSLYVSASR